MDAEAIYQNAIAFDEAGKHNQAAALYKELVAAAKDPRFHVAYGICLQRLGHWEESVKQLQRGIDLKPHYGEGDARLFLAESLLQAGQKKKAVEQWKLIATMKPQYPSYEAVPNKAKKKLAEHTA